MYYDLKDTFKTNKRTVYVRKICKDQIFEFC